MNQAHSARRFTRRAFARAVASLFGLIAIGSRWRPTAAAGFEAFVLNPDAGGCRGCNACRRHAENKRFATFLAADAGRAHPNCRCAVRSIRVSRIEFVDLFGEPDSDDFRTVRDLRTPIVRELVAPRGAGGLEMPVARVR